MKICVKNKNVVEMINMDNDERREMNLPPMEPVIPTDTTIQLVNNIIADNNFRKGLDQLDIQTHLDSSTTTVEEINEVDRVRNYLGMIPNTCTIRSVSMTNKGLVADCVIKDAYAS